MSKTSRKYLRFRIPERIEHWLFFASFTTLAITGLIQKFSMNNLSQQLIAFLGGIEQVRIIHRTASVVMMLEAVYHLGQVGYKLFVRRDRTSMLPGLKDVRNAWQMLRYNLGLEKRKPQQDRYTFEEKFEYWAVVWGTIIMGITGFMMWNPIATTHLLPGQFIPAAKAAHGGEALLAVLAILVWHLYHVHLRHFNMSMFTGYLTEKEMLDEHPLELAHLKKGDASGTADPKCLAKRKRLFFPIYGVLAALMLFGIYAFAELEQTAIETVPPAEEVVVYEPLSPTPFPTLERMPTTWQDGFADLIIGRCGYCHGDKGGLDLFTYQSALEGGLTGPAIVPGDPEASLLITIMEDEDEDHDMEFMKDELAWVREWIAEGAPEK
jgi:cytochrome b subunit of formate dehydrogenase